MRFLSQAKVKYGSPMSDAPIESAGIEPVIESAQAAHSAFAVHLDNFEGPFDLLLQLISRHKMDVTDVALSVVTDDFIAYIKALGASEEGWDLDETTEFLVVAATLLDLKAARLLPSGEIEDESDLALLEARDLLFARLLQYRAFKEISTIFASRIADAEKSFPRLVSMEPQFAQLLPEVLIGVGAERFAAIAQRILFPKAAPVLSIEHIHRPLVSVTDEVVKIVDHLRKNGRASFRTLVADAENTLVVVARFLGLLELYKEGVIRFEQVVALGELQITWVGSATGEISVSDEFDIPPEQVEDETEEE